jgi:hypothetical protein
MMRTIVIDDKTYASWIEQAEASGLSLEEWLKQKTATALPHIDKSEPNDMTIDERLDHFDRIMEKIENLNIGTDSDVDWSRKSIYNERGI